VEEKLFLGFILTIHLFSCLVRIKGIIRCSVPGINLDSVGCVFMVGIIYHFVAVFVGVLYVGGDGVDFEGAVWEIGEGFGDGVASDGW